jgi:hypothetical protein
MKKTVSIILTLGLCCIGGLMAIGSCRRSKNTSNTQATPPPESQAISNEMTAPVDIPIAPDPENASRFTLIYQNNMNAEFEPCG